MKVRWHLWFMVFLFIASVAGGAAIYSYFEGWSVFDSFYFVVITITTIGYGDFSPVTFYGKVFTIFLAFFGVALAFYVLSQISSGIFHKHISKRVDEIKRDVKKDEEIKKNIQENIKEAFKKVKKKK